MRKTKLKLHKNLSVDMAGLCDVAFLVLVFFISVSHFEQWEPLKIETPSSEKFVCMAYRPYSHAIIYVAVNKVMLQFVDCDSARKIALSAMAQKYGLKFSIEEEDKFLKSPITGAPIGSLKLYNDQYLEWDAPVNRPGIPYTDGNSQLYNWILEARKAEYAIHHRALLITIKADKNVSYSVIKQVINILQKQKVNRFELLTNSQPTAL